MYFVCYIVSHYIIMLYCVYHVTMLYYKITLYIMYTYIVYIRIYGHNSEFVSRGIESRRHRAAGSKVLKQFGRSGDSTANNKGEDNLN